MFYAVPSLGQISYAADSTVVGDRDTFQEQQIRVTRGSLSQTARGRKGSGQRTQMIDQLTPNGAWQPDVRATRNRSAHRLSSQVLLVRKELGKDPLCMPLDMLRTEEPVLGRLATCWGKWTRQLCSQVLNDKTLAMAAIGIRITYRE